MRYAARINSRKHYNMVTYRMATESDYDKINDFHNRIYCENRTKEQFLWEFNNCPFGKSIYVIAIEDDKIIGTNCVIPIVLKCNDGELFKTGKSEDTLVDPDYRGKNIFNGIYEVLFEKCKEAGIVAIWGFTMAKKPFTKIGFDIPFNHKQSIIVNDVVDTYKYLKTLNRNNSSLRNFKILGLCVLSKLKKTVFSFQNRILNFNIVENENITQNVDSLIENSQKDTKNLFFINQTKEFQKWRVYDNPNYNKVKTYAVYDRDEKMLGLFIINVDLNNIGHVIQTTFDSSLSLCDKTNIMGEIIKRIFISGVKAIRNWHFNTNIVNLDEIDLYKKLNFVFINNGTCFVWRKINDDCAKLNPRNFILSRISSQGIT